MRMMILFVAVISLLAAGCSPGGPGIEMTGAVSTAVEGTVMPETPPPADYTPPADATRIPNTPIPSIQGGLHPVELKYRLLEAYPDFFFCDPDYYPVAMADEMELARERFAEIQADPGQFQIILVHNAMSGLASFTDEQKLTIYREYKRLNSLYLQPAGDRYTFQFAVGQEGSEAFLITGQIDLQGKITVDSKETTIATCPICLSVGSMIDTPEGPVPVQELKAGDVVWTMDEDGKRLAAPLIRTGHVAVPSTHKVLHLVLEDGRQLWASPGHPLPDGRILKDLKPGEKLDGSTVLSIEPVQYSAQATYDILPASATGFYWVNGIPLASTIK